MSNNPEFTRLEEKCASVYGPGQKFYNENEICNSIYSDSRFLKARGRENVEERTFTCNIPNWNTTTQVHTYWDKSNNMICPVGGWCNGNNNQHDGIVTEENPNVNNEITDKRLDVRNQQNVATPLCPQNIFEEPSAAPSETPSETPSCPPLFMYNYTNNDCTLINKDNEILQKFCPANTDGTVTWTPDENGQNFCSDTDGNYRLYQNVNNFLTCNDDTNIPVVPPVYRLYDVNNQKNIECPSGYCLKDNGELNMNYINQHIAQTDKHPFCPGQ
jgi:hypothetical protein